MSDKPELQHVPHSTGRVVSKARSSLIIRGLNDTKSLLEHTLGTDAQIHYDHGLTVYALQDYAQAASYFRKAAELEHRMAQFLLGLMYSRGEGVGQDYSEAAVWWRKAASHGVPDAQLSVGYLYEHGRGVAQDDEMAIFWYVKAADHGDAIAQWILGLRYEEGRGVRQDYAQAVAWYP